MEIQQPPIARYDIEPDALLQLAQIHRTQMRRARIAFGQVIRAVHEAMEIDAMLNAEHVRHLVRQHLAASSQQQLPGILRPFVAETRIVAGKAVDAHAPAQRSLAAN